jgi:hypothetical protein
MSKHQSRKQRWTQVDSKRYASALGTVVYERNGWFAVLDYRLLAPRQNESDPAQWTPHTRQLGPYRRPRNAMVALEREATMLKNRHGQEVLFGEQLWAEA